MPSIMFTSNTMSFLEWCKRFTRQSMRLTTRLTGLPDLGAMWLSFTWNWRIVYHLIRRLTNLRIKKLSANLILSSYEPVILWSCDPVTLWHIFKESQYSPILSKPYSTWRCRYIVSRCQTDIHKSNTKLRASNHGFHDWFVQPTHSNSGQQR